ncbi:MAG: YHS domain-containing protein [Planctomycetales bacterium]|nr:YHS domain-containing protein [Planctomycetales bacterium]
MAIDPICGMTVDEATARSGERDGKTVYFCSEHCRQKFLGSESNEKSNATHDHKGHDQKRASEGQVSGKYICPMHPQIEQDGPGQCPICGMALEPKTVQPDAQEDDSELRSMTLRFCVSAALTLPVLSVSMLPMIGVPVDRWLGSTVFLWLQLLLSTPVVLWGGWPFFERGFRSIVTWNLAAQISIAALQHRSHTSTSDFTKQLQSS